MKKIFKLLLCLALVLSFLPIGTVSASDGPAAEDKVIYFSSKDAGTYWSGLSIGGGVDAYKITNVKSSKPSVLEVTSTRGSKTSYIEKDYATGEETTGTDGSAYINYKIKKAGTATISYKIGKKTYKTKITAKKYVNPCASIKLPGVNGGKDFASSFANASYNSSTMTISKSIKTFPKLTVKAKSGWQISSIYVAYWGNDNNRDSHYIDYSFEAGATSKTVYVGPMKKGKRYYLSVSFTNKKDGGSISVNTYLE